MSLQEQGKLLLRYALHFGALLGLFWMLRYSFFIADTFSYHIFKYLYFLMDIGTMLLIYIFSVKYVMSDPQHPKNFWQCLLFVIAICFFASFFEGVILYAHYAFIDPSYFSKMTQPLIDHIRSMKNIFSMPQADFENMMNVYITILSSKLTYVLALFARNTLLGIALGALMGFFLRPRKRV